MFKLVILFSCPLERSPDPNRDVAAACRSCIYAKVIVLQTLELFKKVVSKSTLVTVTWPLYLIERDSGGSTTLLV